MEWADRLVGAARERQPNKMSARERRAVHVSALAFVLAVAGVAALFPIERDVDPLVFVGFVIGYMLISRVEFEVGSIYAVPEALLLVPMLFVLPLALIPVVVATAFLLVQVPAFVGRRIHVDRWIYALSDAGFAIGPVIVVGLLAPGPPAIESLWVYALAFAAQTAIGGALSIWHQCVGFGSSLPEQLRVLAWSLRIEGALWTVGLMAAFASYEHPAVLLGVAPLVWMLQVFSRERKERFAKALELNRAYRGTVMLLSDVVEADDHYTADHCRSVVELVTAVADEMEITEDHRQELEFAALLHDVGKIAIPNEILNKPSRLTEDEFDVMKTHTIEGQHMLDRVGGLLGRVGAIVRSCHERWDGRGYPDGLAGEEIPLAARIVFCCDAFNAMTTNRPYRAAMSVEAALTELRENAGTQFDPWVVAALTRVVDRGFVDRRPTPAEAVRALFTQRQVGAGAA